MAKKSIPRYVGVRKGLLLIMMLLFPILLNYMSPYVIIMGASEGVMNGSMILFIALFVSALFFGRMWCGWLCPGGAVQEFAVQANPRRVNPRRLDWIKWMIWVLWLGLIIFMLVKAGGIAKVDPLYMTEHGISVTEVQNYIVYYGVLFLLVVPSLIFGKYFMCHTFCWMAPFMILGRKISNWLNLPGVRLKADSDNCISCGKCTAACPRSLDVQKMVEVRNTEHDECVQCKSCVAVCPNDVLSLKIAKLK